MSDIHVPDILGPRVQLCWRQGRHTMVRCDRALGHAGPHTWEWAEENSALRQRHAELAPHLDHLCAMYAAGAPRPGGQQVQPPAEAISQPTLRRTGRAIVEAWLTSEAKAALKEAP